MVVEAEQDPAKARPYEYSLMGRRHLTSAFEAAGYESFLGWAKPSERRAHA